MVKVAGVAVDSARLGESPMDSLVSVAAVLVVASLTPGPNNVMVMAAGARGGLAAARPIIAGVILGGLLLLGLVWGGIAAAAEDRPGLRLVAVLGGALYLVHLGAGMMGASTSRRCAAAPQRHELERPTGWLGVALFQILNPKAWILLVSASAAMSRDFAGARGLAFLAVIYALRSVLSLTLWALAGSALDRGLATPRARRWLDRALGVALVLCAVALVRVVA